jgi:chloramphenicol 3-O-phosphotransferase
MPLPLIRARRTSLRRQLHIEATGSSSSNSVHADTQALNVVELTVSISILLEQTWMSRWKSLRSVADNLEDVNCETVGRIVELLVEALTHVLLLDWLVDERWDNGLRVPVRETVHDRSELFVGVDRALTSIFVLEGSIGIDCGFYSGVSDC